ncbi:methyltransferase domain-containing protein [Photobacterium gaetbulicola]|uniref:Methyltransferase type 12 domain-containing protein n=1 Tax=Photobacterium gaetbulicola Gung47 TaxID=658445 RepID=A0A0C5WK70_9GAMM|nr:class I SAM-dependent methyltransferase [Photobacterium gaetbulicola]AJR06627.1 hypothetical protein H744_1c1609 [Photobacterium gaetbulicola Gung47]PSU13951.1 methyltransferase domain-containing protein [Photobacterium gaetbulicola]
MLSEKIKLEQLNNYIDALSGIEYIATHLIAHALLKLGDDRGNGFSISSIPTGENKETLLFACISALDKAGLLIENGQDEKIQLKKENIKSIKTLAALKESLILSCPAIDAHMTLLLQCAKSLPAVIAGKADGLEVLFPQGRSEMVANTYRGNELQDEFNKKVAQQVVSVLQRAVGSSEPLPRVLEIGAGTCATTRAVIKEMERSNSMAELCISDISLTLVKDAEKQFAAQYPFTSFEVLDIEDSDDETITGNGTFDVIYASNVLHATSSIRPVINNIVKLLRPGGVLIINELVAFSVFATITFGLTEGWWLFSDNERIPFSPLIDAENWEQLLIESGFESVSFFYPPYEKGQYCSQAVISTCMVNNR